MLPKQHRLVKDKDFKKVRKQGRSFFTPIIVFKILKNNLDVSRFGVVVGTKVSKKAVRRNKIKRQLNEIIRSKLDAIKPGYDVSIITLPKILEENYREIKSTVEKIFKKMKIL